MDKQSNYKDDFVIEKVEAIEEHTDAGTGGTLQPTLHDEIKETEERLRTLKEQAVAQGENQNKFIPMAIILASVVVGAAIYATNSGQKLPAKSGSASIGDTGGSPAVAPPYPLPSGQQGIVDVSADDDPFLGKADALVVIIEFSDFQCPFCRRFWSDTLPQFKRDYIDTGKVKFVYRDFPLPFHEGARSAAEGAECAEDQGRFWEMHDAIFAGQNAQGDGTIQFTKDDVKKWASGAGLDLQKFNECLDSGKYKIEVDKDYADGAKAGVSGTPTVFINGRIVVGAQPFTSFTTIIDEELKKAGK